MQRYKTIQDPVKPSTQLNGETQNHSEQTGNSFSTNCECSSRQTAAFHSRRNKMQKSNHDSSKQSLCNKDTRLEMEMAMQEQIKALGDRVSGLESQVQKLEEAVNEKEKKRAIIPLEGSLAKSTTS